MLTCCRQRPATTEERAAAQGAHPATGSLTGGTYYALLICAALLQASRNLKSGISTKTVIDLTLKVNLGNKS